jgi:hypothetical protein
MSTTISFKLRWDSPLYSQGKVFVADLHGEGHTYRYVVRRVRPYSREWAARRDGETFTKASYPSPEAAKAICEADAVSPKSELSLKHLAGMVDLKKLQHTA